jgi:3-hexulose-6-phosphate synthase
MKLQTALDRITIEEALRIAELTAPYVDVFEVGTSLIKEFGLASVRRLKEAFPQHQILADIKTIDEGAYEFRSVFEAGADIATVMAAASVDTIDACYSVAKEYGMTMMIDVLEEGTEKLEKLSGFKDAIFCVHTPTDLKDNPLLDRLKAFKEKFPWVKKTAVAGGVRLEEVPQFKAVGCDIVIVGSAITKASDPGLSAKAFQKAINE